MIGELPIASELFGRSHGGNRAAVFVIRLTSAKERNMKAVPISKRDAHDRPAAIRAARFFVLFFLAGFAFGAWLTHTFGWGGGSGHHLRTVGLSLGLLTLAFSACPLLFALAIVRKLRTH
jgi:hypothetical protein